MQAHLLVVAADAADRQAALAEFKEEIQNPFAVRSPVDQVAQQVKPVFGCRTESYIDKPAKCGGTAMDVADDEGSR
jgi:hypothetical protein